MSLDAFTPALRWAVSADDISPGRRVRARFRIPLDVLALRASCLLFSAAKPSDLGDLLPAWCQRETRSPCAARQGTATDCVRSSKKQGEAHGTPPCASHLHRIRISSGKLAGVRRVGPRPRGFCAPLSSHICCDHESDPGRTRVNIAQRAVLFLATRLRGVPP